MSTDTPSVPAARERLWDVASMLEFQTVVAMERGDKEVHIAADIALKIVGVMKDAAGPETPPSETRPVMERVYDGLHNEVRITDKPVRSWEWPVNTVGKLIASLQTLPPQMPFYTAYFVEIDGVKVARVRNPSLSRETTDGFRVEKYSPDDESLVMWASQDQRTANSASGAIVSVPRALVERAAEGIRRAVQNGNLDERSMAADAGLLLEAELRRG